MNASLISFPESSCACLWSFQIPATDRIVEVAPPVARLDGQPVILALENVRKLEGCILAHGVEEHGWVGRICGHPSLSLEARFRIAPKNPVIRFQYILRSHMPVRLTNDERGCNQLKYAALCLQGFPEAKEIRLSSFLESVHSFALQEVNLPSSHFENEISAMGPILTATDGETSLLLAYEHGSQYPNKFLEFRLASDRKVSLEAVKGNYFNNRVVGPEEPFETLWFQFAAIVGSEHQLAASYREFVLRWQTQNLASREPWVFYNTWNHQERLKNWHKRPYLSDMTQDRMMAEIDVAHHMGIEVFVIDTGWYKKTGDWQVNLARFPDGLKAVKEALDAREMKLGLWFNPTVAAVTSRMRAAHEDCVQEWRGVPHAEHAVWETEASQGLCLVSRYGEAYAEEMIRLVREVGVTYFKWDAITQEGPFSCDGAAHYHGGPANSPEERAACYGFEQVRAMNRIIDKVCAACPEAIFDFDITEGGRSVGLAFLASGKYFLINNGPYFSNFDLPPPNDGNANMFFFPGPARAWVCRTPLSYDKWIPSVLFLTHYLPDEPESSQMLNVASLMLGQNGIWGDLLGVPEEGVSRIRAWLDVYKKVRHDITAATPIRVGVVGGSPEIHEKINPASGRGVVVIFANSAGTYDYVTENVVAREYVAQGIELVFDSRGRGKLRANFGEPGARMIFFGTE